MQRTVIVLGVIGWDVHSIGNRLMEYALKEKEFNVINLGVQVPQDEFIKAAIETSADAILIGSLCGHAKTECRGVREKCTEAGLENILIYVGGNLTTNYETKWEDVEKHFRRMGINRVFRPSVVPSKVISILKEDLHGRKKGC